MHCYLLTSLPSVYVSDETMRLVSPPPRGPKVHKQDLLWAVLESQGTAGLGATLVAGAAYAVLVVLARRDLHLSAPVLKALCRWYYLVMIAILSFGNPPPVCRTLMACGQFVCIACYVDTEVHIPGQLGSWSSMCSGR